MAVSRGFSLLAKRHWRQRRISEYIAAVVMRVAAVIAVARGVQGDGDEEAGRCLGKSAGGVAVRNSGACSYADNSAAEAAV